MGILSVDGEGFEGRRLGIVEKRTPVDALVDFLHCIGYVRFEHFLCEGPSFLASARYQNLQDVPHVAGSYICDTVLFDVIEHHSKHETHAWSVRSKGVEVFRDDRQRMLVAKAGVFLIRGYVPMRFRILDLQGLLVERNMKYNIFLHGIVNYGIFIQYATLRLNHSVRVNDSALKSPNTLIFS